MGFPKEAHALFGGCNCSAVRLRINVPPIDDRHRMKSALGNSIILPIVVMDHEVSHGLAGCIPTQLWIMKQWVTINCIISEHQDNQGLGIDKKVSKKTASHIIEGRTVRPSDKTQEYTQISLDALLDKDPANGVEIRKSFVRVFKLDKSHFEVHCGRCASSLVQGSTGDPNVYVNVACLAEQLKKRPHLAPLHHFNWDNAPDWVKNLTSGNKTGGSLPKHPRNDPTKLLAGTTESMDLEIQAPSLGTQTDEDLVWHIEPVAGADYCMDPGAHRRPVVNKPPKRKYGLDEVVNYVHRLGSAQGLDVLRLHGDLTELLKNGELNTDNKDWWKSIQRPTPASSDGLGAKRLKSEL